MKKIISVAILVLVWCFLAYILLWQVTISPMIEMYKINGIIGSIIYFLVEILFFACLFGVAWLVAWASDNLF